MIAPNRSIFRRLLELAWPIIGLNVLSVLALAVDTAMCGRLPEAETALEALGFATQLVFLLMVAMMGLTVGTIAVVSRAHGAGHRDRVNHVLLQSTQLTLILGVTVAIAGNVFAGDMLWLLGASADTREAGVAYLRPVLGGTAFYYLNILYASVLRGVGNTRLPFFVALASNVLNFFLNYCLILGNLGFPALGVQGAAIATVVSYAFGAVLMITLLHRRVVEGLYLPLRPRRIDGSLAAELFRVGAPAALDMVTINAAFLSIIGMLGRIDEAAVAAHGIGLRVQALAFVPGLSISQATAAMVGNALGAHDEDEARRVFRAAAVTSTTIMTVLALSIVFGAHGIVRVFDVQPGTTLEELTVLWMRVLGWGMPIVGVHVAFMGTFQGAGATRVSLGINALAVALQIPGSLALGFLLDLGPFGVWVAFPLSYVVRIGVFVVAYRRGRWARLGLHAA